MRILISRPISRKHRMLKHFSERRGSSDVSIDISPYVDARIMPTHSSVNLWEPKTPELRTQNSESTEACVLLPRHDVCCVSA